MGLRVKPGMPEEVVRVVKEVLLQLKANLPPKDFRGVVREYSNYYDESDYCSPPAREWRIGSGFEDGTSSAIFDLNKKKWYFREPWEGRDFLVEGGELEVIAYLKALFYDI